MSDRELLEKAAKAAGLWDQAEGCIDIPWSPLTDDGDEARLEASLGLDVVWWDAQVSVGGVDEQYDMHGGDKQKARRYAGVRAAAAIHDAKGQP